MATGEAFNMKELAEALKSLAITPEQIQQIALTPEKLREALKPYEDPAIVARNKRSKEQNRRQFLEGIRLEQERQARCAHKDKNQRWSISVVHNYPDGLPRGICALCQCFIQPARRDFTAPTDDYPDGEQIILPAHPLYHIVTELESMA